MTQSQEPSTGLLLAPLVPGAILQGRYRIVRQMGRGGMGAVYEAEDQRLGITIALKETLSTEASVRKQFEHEARLLAGMQHPALPRVSDHFVEGNRAFLVMQFIGGSDLANIISQQPGPFPRYQVIVWAHQLIDALIYLHSRDRQVIHRDIKPHNLKLTSSGQIVLLDFGLAKSQPADSSVTSSRAFFGYTRHYAPLEQIQDQRTDARSDIYALGATLYHLLTGIKPKDALVRASALVNGDQDPLQPANKINVAVDPEIAAILTKAMAQKSEDRYATAVEFRDALRKVARVGWSQDIKVKGAIAVVNKSSQEIEPTVVRSSATNLSMAMVESNRRFGPGAVTALLVIAVMVVAGILYGATQWLQPLRKVSATTGDAIAVERQPGSIRKTERSGLVNNASSSIPSKSGTDNDNEAEKANRRRESAAVDSKALDSKADARRESVPVQKEQRKEPNKVDAPSIRLPNPDIGDKTSPLRPEAGIHGYGPWSPAQQFFRADGTPIR